MIYKINKIPSNVFLTALFLSVTFIVSACGDPVIYYHPKDWAKDDNTWFTKSYENFDIKITDMGGITINDHLIPEAIIYNRSKLPLTLERVILNSGGTEYTAHPFGEKSWETIPPNDSRRLASEFEFNKSIDKTLKNPVEMTLILKNEKETFKLAIPMVETQMTNP